MTTIIHLHRGNSGKEIWVNAEMIKFISKDMSGSKITFADGETLYTAESPEVIWGYARREIADLGRGLKG